MHARSFIALFKSFGVSSVVLDKIYAWMFTFYLGQEAVLSPGMKRNWMFRGDILHFPAETSTSKRGTPHLGTLGNGVRGLNAFLFRGDIKNDRKKKLVVLCSAV